MYKGKAEYEQMRGFVLNAESFIHKTKNYLVKQSKRIVLNVRRVFTKK